MKLSFSTLNTSSIRLVRKRRLIHIPAMNKQTKPAAIETVYRLATASTGSGRDNIHQFRKNSTNPAASTVQIRRQVNSCSLTPFVPRHESASSRRANNFV